MEALLNFNAPLDMGLLDNVCQASHYGNPKQIREAQAVLSQFKSNENAWQLVDKILENSKSEVTQYFGLQILEPVIQYRWRTLQRAQRDGIKNYLIEKIVQVSSTPEIMAQNKLVLEKLNVTLVQVVKQEWPHNWDTFVQEIVGASRTNESLCENNMIILKTLSEEVFDFSSGQLTHDKITELKTSFKDQFLTIYELCEYVMTNSSRPSLLSATLETLNCFLSWIPAGYIFQYNMVPMLIQKFLPVPIFRNVAMRCLNEIGVLDIGSPNHYATLLRLFMESLMSFLPQQIDIAAAVENGDSEDFDFIQNLALFFAGFFKVHRTQLETPESGEVIIVAHQYLAKISLVDDDEIFKICLEYWGMLASDLFHEIRNNASPLMLGGMQNSQRLSTYAPILTTVRVAMIQRMARPEEVIVTEDENGNLIRQHLKDTAAINMYNSMRDTLVFLTHLDPQNTIDIVEKKLTDLRALVEKRAHKDTWWQPLNCVCWAVGSTSGVQTDAMEKKFLVNVIRELLEMCEIARGKDNKAVIATNIMYVVGQYPRFLTDHWKFLKTVVNKLFEFMHEVHPGVQDMACDTFLKISKSCRRRFVMKQVGESKVHILVILQRLPDVIHMLKPHQVQTFYESVGYMVGASPNREALIPQLMMLPNQKWMEIMSNANMSNAQSLQETEVANMITNILKTNVRVATSLGECYVLQLSGFFQDLLQVYKTYSDAISHAVANEGPKVTRTTVVKSWRSVKQTTLQLLSMFVQKCKDKASVKQTFIPPMLNAVLSDYNNNHPLARDSEVLSLMTVIMKQLESEMAPLLPRIFETVFDCTVNMIKENYNDFPLVRKEFFEFLRAVNRHCFPALIGMSNYIGPFVDSVIWGFKHTRPDIADVGLHIIQEFWQNVTHSEAANAFFQSYVENLLDNLFYVLVDTFHKPGFKMQSNILRNIFYAVESNQIQVPLFDTSKHSFPTNSAYLSGFIANSLQRAFSNLTQAQIQSFVQGLFAYSNNPQQFKQHLRDFLVKTKEFGDDNADLYLEEAEHERNAQLAQRKEIRGLEKREVEVESMTD